MGICDPFCAGTRWWGRRRARSRLRPAAARVAIPAGGPRARRVMVAAVMAAARVAAEAVAAAAG